MIPQFRAWCKIGNEMIYSNMAEDEDGKIHSSLSFFFGNFVEALNGSLAENVILMQSTGLKDKNGKEMFEGDIVRYNHSTAEHNLPLNCIARVEFWSERAKFRLIGNDIHDKFNDIIWSEIEVIGNIHENPELLEGYRHE